MKLDIISYNDLLNTENKPARDSLINALLNKGIVGISNVPEFKEKSRAYLEAARRFSALEETIKQNYAPLRDTGDTEGYELGAEWFRNTNDEWQIDDKKASYYAFVPDKIRNKWPREVDLKTPYLELGELIFATGKIVLNVIGLNETIGLKSEYLHGYGRMLHYHKESDITNANPDWCGAHFDHCLLTGLMPAYYFQNGKEIAEPEEAGLVVAGKDGGAFEKVSVPDQSIMLFQVGEFGQLVSNDRIRATKHLVKKAYGGIDRYAFALFYDVINEFVINSTSKLASDKRYQEKKSADGSVTYGAWSEATYARYRAAKPEDAVVA